MRFSVRRLLVLVGVAGPLIYLIIRFGFEVGYGIDDAYAKWGAADMLIDYMEDHDGRWPSGWDDLAPYFADSNGRVAGWSYARFQKHIWIDFKADPTELLGSSLATNQATFNVIRATYSNSAFADGPNQQIHDYFQTRSANASASSANSAVNP